MAAHRIDKSFDEYIEKVRRNAFQEGYDRAMLEQALERARSDPRAARSDTSADSTSKPYLSKTPLEITKKLTLEYLEAVSPRPVGPTEVEKNVQAREGITVSYSSVKRSLDELAAEGAIEKVSDRRWRSPPKLRSVGSAA